MIQKHHPQAQVFFLEVPMSFSLYFWAITIFAIPVGEIFANVIFFNLHLGLNAGSWLLGGLMLAVLYVQVRTRQYIPWFYWFTLVMVSIAAGFTTDILTDRYGFPLGITCLVFTIALLTTFVIWYRTEGTVSMQCIDSPHCEIFYWTAVFFALALGTSIGDLITETQIMSYAQATLFYGSVMGLIMLGYYGLRLNAIAVFWITCILIRPLSMALSHFLSQPAINGGQGLGSITLSFAFVVGIVALVFFLSISQRVNLRQLEGESQILVADEAGD